MSKYTTGEIAKLCGVTIRTVQYYDKRGILNPSELSEGGRRLYSEEDVKRLDIICFLRGLGFNIESISRLMSEDDPGSVIMLLLEQQEQTLTAELNECTDRLSKIKQMKRGLKEVKNFSVESIGDIAHTMTGKKELRIIHRNILLSAIPVTLLQFATAVIWIYFGIWWPFVVWAVIDVIYGVFISRYYFNSVAYICPQCHTVFVPKVREAFFANHTPSTRKLTCSSCGHKGFCVEIARPKENN